MLAPPNEKERPRGAIPVNRVGREGASSTRRTHLFIVTNPSKEAYSACGVPREALGVVEADHFTVLGSQWQRHTRRAVEQALLELAPAARRQAAHNKQMRH